MKNAKRTILIKELADKRDGSRYALFISTKKSREALIGRFYETKKEAKEDADELGIKVTMLTNKEKWGGDFTFRNL